MTSDRWREIEDLFNLAVEADTRQRQELLRAADTDVRGEVERLLESDGKAATLITEAISEAETLLADVHVDPQFGPWRGTGILGRGGMGVVYRAVRDDQAFEKSVAVKVLHMGLETPLMLERFRQERQILASLEHPQIARLLDGGTTETGLPYIVLEYVDGAPVTHYCEREKLSRASRLELFLKICDAVEYAHRNLIVHRDLKPANILVTPEGAPKLLDFGIARLIDADGKQTATLMPALTPDYASPEQVRGETITTASDVYSLGVILYELLTGRRPYRITAVTPLEISRVVEAVEPEPAGLGADLDNILRMAMRKEPGRRYGSVREFAEDIRSFLEHRPVSARPDTLGYRTAKFLRRRWATVAAGAALIVSVSVGLGVSLYEARLANARFRDVRTLATGFLFDFDKEISRTPGNVKARHMLAGTAQTYLDKLAKDSGQDYELKYELAMSYEKLGDVQGMPGPGNLGMTAEAVANYRKAAGLLDQIRMRDRKYRVGLYQALGRLARLVGEQGDQNEAIRLATQAAQAAEAVLEEAPADRELAASAASAWTNLATIQLANYHAEDALVSNRKALGFYQVAIPENAKPAARAPVAASWNRLGIVERALGDFDAAEKAWRQSEEIRNSILAQNPGDPGSKVARSLIRLSFAELEYSPRYPSRNNPASAVGAWEEVAERSQQNAAADANDISAAVDALFAEANLTLTYLARGRPGDVEKADRVSEAMSASLETTLRKAPKYGVLLLRLPLFRYARAAVLAGTNRCAAALPLSRDGLAAQRRLPGQTPDMKLDLTAPLLRHAGVAAACKEDAEAKAASDEAYRLLDGLTAETGRYFMYASQARRYCLDFARELKRLPGHEAQAAEAERRAAAFRAATL
jgi:tRNA A-37 threonylcarbamoyl transferase component Bud32